MKIIVTHFNPDLDAVASIWIIKKFLPVWSKAKIEFVPAGETFQGLPVDSNPEILHVDTGLGELDHHQTDEFVCAAQLCWKKVVQNKNIHLKKLDKEAVERLLDVVCQIDHGREIVWPESKEDRFCLFLEEIIGGLNGVQDDLAVVEFGLIALEGVFKTLKDKIRAEETLRSPKAIEFETEWGKGIGVESGNDAVLQLGEKMGYSVVIRKDPKKKYVRIYARFDRGVDLSKVYQKLKELDPQATWFLHRSKCILLNGSPRNPKMRPTNLKLNQIIQVLKNT
jgi:hypothetical protein